MKRTRELRAAAECRPYLKANDVFRLLSAGAYNRFRGFRVFRGPLFDRPASGRPATISPAEVGSLSKGSVISVPELCDLCDEDRV